MQVLRESRVFRVCVVMSDPKEIRAVKDRREISVHRGRLVPRVLPDQ